MLSDPKAYQKAISATYRRQIAPFRPGENATRTGYPMKAAERDAPPLARLRGTGGFTMAKSETAQHLCIKQSPMSRDALDRDALRRDAASGLGRDQARCRRRIAEFEVIEIWRPTSSFHGRERRTRLKEEAGWKPALRADPGAASPIAGLRPRPRRGGWASRPPGRGRDAHAPLRASPYLRGRAVAAAWAAGSRTMRAISTAGQAKRAAA